MQSALFIGRFQPFHNGHLEMVKKILKENQRIIIAVGSAEKNYTATNPLTASERFQMIEETLKEAKIPAEKYCIIPITNINNYALWVNHVNTFVPPYTRLYTGSEVVKACYEGKYKTRNSTKTGPEIIQLKRLFKISATRIREDILKNKNWGKMVPAAVKTLLEKWEIPNRIKNIKETMNVTKYND